jgi:spore protease
LRLEIFTKFSSQLDLAVEAHDLLKGQTGQEVSGVQEEKKEHKNATVRTIKILNETGAQRMGKKRGTYITIEAPGLRENNRQVHKELANILAENLRPLIANLGIKPEQPILVVGLGNWDATPDALGPRVVQNVLVTRHLYEYAPQELTGNLRSVSAISPGVLGITGVETAEIVKGVTEKINPGAVIAIDSLAAGDLNRINTTIQIADTGINPGSGIGNTRKGLNKEYLGVPVIALGVPTVVRAAVLIFAAFNQLLEETPEIDKYLNQQNAEKALNEVLKPFGGELTVTPKEVDDLITNTAKILAAGINQGLHSAIGPDDFGLYLH